MTFRDFLLFIVSPVCAAVHQVPTADAERYTIEKKCPINRDQCPFTIASDMEDLSVPSQPAQTAQPPAVPGSLEDEVWRQRRRERFQEKVAQKRATTDSSSVSFGPSSAKASPVNAPSVDPRVLRAALATGGSRGPVDLTGLVACSLFHDW